MLLYSGDMLSVVASVPVHSLLVNWALAARAGKGGHAIY